ncbi:LacI family transcriptional regulator [Xaviernesmea oryzae]|uniref:LacI family transcriptional regulator n=1 Tax=Xaviernesmea oryzae TaxID=464029 RepID=A0A1Q9B354_9HYPH|nr:LacI family DNA-binding transcriptional regulator [Xaviernesmea oryzae]OLP62438.1 LacI family transcriptional regulator [Xaviernesmea oryzae]SEM16352.1 transcriptional regulator, LacI family [Xaviernesmea oryzae]
MSEEPPRRRTIRDVAKAAGVSISTASNALNGIGRTNPETREKVRRIAEQIGFRPNALARSLLTKRSHSIGIITNDTYGRLTLPMTAGVSEALVDHGVSAFLCATNNDPRLAQLHLEALLDKQVDGIIFTATRADLTPPIDLTRLAIPVVYAFAIGPPTAPTFIPDDAQGARLAVQHLLDRGYRRILHITGLEDYLAAQLRAETYRDLAGAELDVLFGEWTEEWGHEAVRLVMERGGDLPEAIFCGSDEIARGVIDALRDRGLKVPEDVAVVGFDNWRVIATQTRPPLTTIDMELKELGRRAGLAMLDLTRGLPVEPGITRLPCSLVVRRSCGA